MSAHQGFIVPLVIGLVVTLLLLGTIAYSQFKPKPSTRTNNQNIETSYATQEECETKTGKTCGFAMCDVVPEGKTFEETCGKGFKAGWKPKPQSPTPTATSDTVNWKTYTSGKYNYNLKYPNEWSIKELESAVVLSPPMETNPTIAITVGIINYKLMPPLPVNYTYQTLRKVDTNFGDVLVQIRSPGSEQYIAQITSGDLTMMFTFGRGLDRKYDHVFDQILSTFKFLN